MFGVLNLNKPEGVTSRQVVNRVKRLVHPVKLGHAGTLDPMATGVLPVCLGRATRLIPLLQKASKVYEAEFILGQTSNTDDCTGDVISTEGVMPVPIEHVTAALTAFQGKITQVPPDFSAVKVNGQRAYARARRGEDFELREKTVCINSIELLEYSWPTIRLRVTCGSGTYIRSIARDLGASLGCGGLMSDLVRTATSGLQLQNSVDPETLTAANLQSLIVNPVSLVTDQLDVLHRCSDEDQVLVSRGRTITNLQSSEDGATVGFLSSDGATLLALGEVAGSMLQPRSVFI